MKEKVFILLVLLSIPFVWAESNSVTRGENETYAVDTDTYVVHLGVEDAVILERLDGTKRILRVDDCIELTVIRTCLDSVSETSATFSEEVKVAVLSAEHDLATDSIDMGASVEGTIAIEYDGELAATDAEIVLSIPRGLSLDTGETGQVLLPLNTVQNTRELHYTIVGDLNGTYEIGALLHYYDGNRTVTEILDNDSLEVTIPVSFTVEYDENTGSDPTELQVEVERESSENFTTTITVLFPTQANVTSYSRLASLTGNTLSIKRVLNSSNSITLNATFALLSPTTEPLTVLITYKNSTDTHTVARNYTFTRRVDDAPALAISIDPMLENRTGTLRVLITGNRTGNLTIESTLLNKSTVAKNDTYEFALGPASAGIYAVKVLFTSISPYGTVQTARGVISVEVESEKTTTTKLAPQPTEDETEKTSPEESDTQQSEHAATAQTHPMVWLGVGAALTALITLLVLVKRFSDPVAKLEHLVERVHILRASLEQDGKLGKHETKEYKELERLERKLSEIQRKL